MSARQTFTFPDGFIPAATHPERKEFPYARLIIPLAKWWMRRVQKLDAVVIGAGKMPVDSPAMVAVNHTGYWDFVYGGIPSHFNGGRLVRFMAKKEIFDVPIAGFLMRAMHHISVDRAAGAKSAEEAVQRLKKGQVVGIFPEATVSRSFEIKELRQGAASIARDGGAPLIPLIIWGGQRIWTKGYKPVWRPKDAKLIIMVGDPVEVTEDAIATTDRLHTAMVQLMEQARAEYTERFGPMPTGVHWVPASMGGTAPTLEAATIEDREIAAERKRKRAEENEATRRRREEQARELEASPGAKKWLLKARFAWENRRR